MPLFRAAVLLTAAAVLLWGAASAQELRHPDKTNGTYAIVAADANGDSGIVIWVHPVIGGNTGNLICSKAGLTCKQVNLLPALGVSLCSTTQIVDFFAICYTIP